MIYIIGALCFALVGLQIWAAFIIPPPTPAPEAPDDKE